jgi:hypothetical protein
MNYIVEIKRGGEYLVEGVSGNWIVYPDNRVGQNADQYNKEDTYEEPPFNSTAETPIEAVVESGMPRQNIAGVIEL